MNEGPGTCRVGIAIVEDEKALVRIYEKVFARNGIVVCFVAYDGLEAVKKYIRCMPRPHVIIMDYRLPVMNGIEATKEILKIDPESRVIFLSADANVEKEAMQSGAFVFLKKPASISLIVGAVERAARTVLA